MLVVDEDELESSIMFLRYEGFGSVFRLLRYLV